MRDALSKSARLFGGQVLTNGRYATLLTASGTGCSLLGELALTRWHADPLEDGDISWWYWSEREKAKGQAEGGMAGAPAPGMPGEEGEDALNTPGDGDTIEEGDEEFTPEPPEEPENTDNIEE